jgi:hypothetical protein
MPDRLLLAILMTAGSGGSGDAMGPEYDRCHVHGPSRLASRGDNGTSDYIPHYAGDCRKGVAHGQGRLEWRMRWTPGRNKAVWEGRFVDGVFVGTQAVDRVVALPGDRYLVLVDDDGHRRTWLVSRSGQFEPMSLCDIDRVVLDANPASKETLDSGDDPRIQSLLDRAARQIHARCPGKAEMSVEIYAHEFRLGPNDNWPTDAFATARLAAREANDISVTDYRNQVTERNQQATHAARRASLLQAHRDHVRQFASTHAFDTWVTSTQVDRNPYAWQGRRIGMLLRLERMIDARTALASQAARDNGGIIAVTGVTPDTFAAQATALAVHVEAERITIAGFTQPLAHVRLIAAESCADDACSAWQIGIDWGKPANGR